MIIQNKKSGVLFCLLFCAQIKAPPAMEFGIATETLKTLNAFPAATGAALKKAFKEIPTNMTVTVALKLPTASKHNLYTFLGFVGALSGLRLMHTGINLLTEPLTSTHKQTRHQAQPSKAREDTEQTDTKVHEQSLAELHAHTRKWAFARCSAGLAILTCGALTIYKFGY